MKVRRLHNFNALTLVVCAGRVFTHRVSGNSQRPREDAAPACARVGFDLFVRFGLLFIVGFHSFVRLSALLYCCLIVFGLFVVVCWRCAAMRRTRRS